MVALERELSRLLGASDPEAAQGSARCEWVAARIERPHSERASDHPGGRRKSAREHFAERRPDPLGRSTHDDRVLVDVRKLLELTLEGGRAYPAR